VPCGAEAEFHDPSDQSSIHTAVLIEESELAMINPAKLAMLTALETRAAQVNVDLDQEVELPPLEPLRACVRLPIPYVCQVG
jgi:hypothetical protein